MTGIICYKCGKKLSSQQALNYHVSSKSCSKNNIMEYEKPIHKTISTLATECESHIICKTNGTITSISSKHNHALDIVEYLGISIYMCFFDISNKCRFAMAHIQALSSNNEDTIHNVIVNDLTDGMMNLKRTVILKDGNELHIFQFKIHELVTEPVYFPKDDIFQNDVMPELIRVLPKFF